MILRNLLILLLLSSCAETRIYEKGKLIAAIQGDAWNVTVKTRSTYFHADTLNHSEPTRAAGTTVSSSIGSVAAAAGTAALLLK